MIVGAVAYRSASDRGSPVRRLGAKFMQGEPEATCDSVGDIPGGIGYTALKAPNRGGVEVGSVSQSLLSQADLFSAQSDSPAKGDLRGLADPHI